MNNVQTEFENNHSNENSDIPGIKRLKSLRNILAIVGIMANWLHTLRIERSTALTCSTISLPLAIKQNKYLYYFWTRRQLQWYWWFWGQVRKNSTSLIRVSNSPSRALLQHKGCNFDRMMRTKRLQTCLSWDFPHTWGRPLDGVRQSYP